MIFTVKPELFGTWVDYREERETGQHDERLGCPHAAGLENQRLNKISHVFEVPIGKPVTGYSLGAVDCLSRRLLHGVAASIWDEA